MFQKNLDKYISVYFCIHIFLSRLLVLWPSFSLNLWVVLGCQVTVSVYQHVPSGSIIIALVFSLCTFVCVAFSQVILQHYQGKLCLVAAPAQPSIDISFNINNNNDNDNPKNKMSNISENFITFHFKTFNGCTQKKCSRKILQVFFFWIFFSFFQCSSCSSLTSCCSSTD